MSLLSALSSGYSGGNQCVLLIHSGALSLGLLVIVDLRLNDHVVLVEEIELIFLLAAWGLVSVVGNDTFGDLAIVLWVFFVQHNEKEIET